MKKDDYKHLQGLIIANSTLLGSLISEMNRKGLIDGDRAMRVYQDNLKEMVDDLSRK